MHGSLGRDRLFEIAQLLGESQATEDVIRSNISYLVGNQSLAKRIECWMPEVFGLVVISHIEDITLPRTFQVRTVDGQWRELPMADEPLLAELLDFAQEIFHSGPRSLFQSLADRSSSVSALNKALDAGANVVGATLSGPAFASLTVAMYEELHRSP